MTTRARRLVERDGQLERLEDVVRTSSDRGGLVLLAGESGFGKTSLLGALASSLDHRYLVLHGSCDAVEIPVAFAPLFEMALSLPADLSLLVREGAARQLVFAGMLETLRSDRVVLMIDDAHWADEATLGLIRYLGRRIDTTNSAMVVTYRQEDIDLSHPLRLVLADVGHLATRIELPALTVEGVAAMSRGVDIDPEALHAATSGNPFFVEQVLDHPDAGVPPAVEEAVAASIRELPDGASEALELLALSPEGLDVGVLVDVLGVSERIIDAACQRRILTADGVRIRCRHELIRASLAGAIPPARRRTIHTRLASVLEARPRTPATIARLAHHTAEAGIGPKAARYSLQAARAAARSGAHRQAASFYRRALAFQDEIPHASRSAVLLAAANEFLLVNEFQEAFDAAAARISLAAGDADRADAVAWAAFFAVRLGDMERGRSLAEDVVAVERNRGPSVALARATSVLARVAMLEGSLHVASEVGDEAMSIARTAGSIAIEVDAAIATGTARALDGDESGVELIRHAGRIAVEHDLDEQAAHALNNLSSILSWELRTDEARVAIDQALAFTTAHELDAWTIAVEVAEASLDILQGRWDEATDTLDRVLDHANCTASECEALVAVATLRARRGDPGAREAIDRALARVDAVGSDAEHLVGTALALEGAWLGIVELGDARTRLESATDLLDRRNDVWGRTRLAFWARRLRIPFDAAGLPGPVGREAAGDPAGAAEEWDRRGCPLEGILVRADLDEVPVHSLFAALDALGAEGVADALRAHLRRRGVKGVPRVPRGQQHPSGLTSRQLEVLALLAAGNSNAEIGNELFISEKTAEHHVSAILSRLGVSSRGQAAALANNEAWV